MPTCIGAINAGSSSIKFALYDARPDPQLLFSGQIEGIGVSPRLRVKDAQGEAIENREWGDLELTHEDATREILQVARKLMTGEPPLAVGHRVVHGGLKYDSPVRADWELLTALEELVPLAPLHQPHNLAPIRTIQEAAPKIPQVACFDTAFHRRQPHVAQSFGVPRQLTASGILRYGFHGISYEFLTRKLRELAPDLSASRTVMAHLGNGASLCAVKDGCSVASTMGFTAVEGLMMGTRCGSIDPGVILYLMRHEHMNEAAIENLIYRKSGLLGVSGISSDMRTLRASSDPAAQEAIELFVYRIVREIGSMAAAAGGIDALVFAGGIGENDAATRAEVVEGCAWLGAELDAERNAHGPGLISTPHSRIAIWVIPTNEEQMIVRHTMSVLAQA